MKRVRHGIGQGMTVPALFPEWFDGGYKPPDNLKAWPRQP
jgi:hypothetical protein